MSARMKEAFPVVDKSIASNCQSDGLKIRGSDIRPLTPPLLASESVSPSESVLSSEPNDDICYEPYIYCLENGKATEDYCVGTFSAVEDANDALCQAFRKIYCLYECDYDLKYDEQDGIRALRIQIAKDYSEDAGDYVSERATSEEDETYWGERDDPDPVEKESKTLLGIVKKSHVYHEHWFSQPLRCKELSEKVYLVKIEKKEYEWGDDGTGKGVEVLELGVHRICKTAEGANHTARRLMAAEKRQAELWDVRIEDLEIHTNEEGLLTMTLRLGYYSTIRITVERQFVW
ncbi:hypothetical protein MMC27_003973 [Xylographa pallens]|nr:hypothetical protein [Xylographa pallens]